MTTRTVRKERSRANALKRGEEYAAKRGKALVLNQPEPEPDPVRDGLVWLIRKGRLTPTRQKAAKLYRDAYREPQAGALNSHLANLGSRGGGGVPSGLPAHGVMAGRLDAEARLAALRGKALAWHEQLVWVMDGVVGGGLTLRELGGGDKTQAAKLEAVLMVALDLVAAWSAAHSVAG